jgi:SAM-dependent methyltransferase
MKCPFCSSERFSRKYVVFSAILDKEVGYFKCKKCSSICQFPFPDKDAIERYYESYHEIKKRMNPGYLEENQLVSFFEERDRTLKEIGFDGLIEDSNNVELGCANGHFLRYLIRKNAHFVTGIDISESLLSDVKIDNVNLIRGDLSFIEENSTDNLYMFNILEHLPDIGFAMSQISRVLKKEGRLVLEVPLSGLISAMFGKRWRFLMPDEHLCIPSVKGLEFLLSGYGLEIKGTTRFGSGFTKGMIPDLFKKFFDFFVKKLKFGDRGAFLVLRRQ